MASTPPWPYRGFFPVITPFPVSICEHFLKHRIVKYFPLYTIASLLSSIFLKKLPKLAEKSVFCIKRILTMRFDVSVGTRLCRCSPPSHWKPLKARQDLPIGLNQVFESLIQRAHRMIEGKSWGKRVEDQQYVHWGTDGSRDLGYRLHLDEEFVQLLRINLRGGLS